MSSNNKKPGKSRGNPDPEKLARILTRELFGSDETTTEDSDASPIPAANILAILAEVDRSHASAERWSLRSGIDGGNPLVDALAGYTVPVEIVRPGGDEPVHGRLSFAPTSRRGDDELWSEPSRDDVLQLAAKDGDRLDAMPSLSASNADDDDQIDTDDWDEPEGTYREADHHRSSEGKLWLEFPAWPENRRLVDLFVCGADDPEPLAVLTVRRCDGGYELTYDADDRDLLLCESVAIDLRLLPTQGERA
jgi:hypothetical protein